MTEKLELEQLDGGEPSPGSRPAGWPICGA